jgi:phage protein D
MSDLPASTVTSSDNGSFAITRVGASQSAAGSEIDIRCSTIPPGTSFRLEMKFQRWTQSTLKNIAGQIVADNPPLQLSYLASEDPFVAAFEQCDESDFVCLSRIAQTVGMSMKIKNKHGYNF